VLVPKLAEKLAALTEITDRDRVREDVKQKAVEQA
jgi:hypothetical protein